MDQQAMKIGEVAARSRVNVQTLRYYERQGLLPKPPRTESNYRLFTAGTVQRVRFVKRAQELGFTLAEIKELLALRIDDDDRCADVRDRAQANIAGIEEKIRTLRSMKRVLVRLTAACAGQGSVSECSILESLDKESW